MIRERRAAASPVTCRLGDVRAVVALEVWV